MNSTVLSITLRALLGRARVLLLLLLPATLLIFATGLRLAGLDGPDVASQLLQSYALAVVLPLATLIAGTGVLGPEIEDGTVIYLLAKPVPRPVIAATKLVAAIGVAALLTAVPTFLAGLILTGSRDGLAAAAGLGALVASIAYCAIFLALSASVRHALAFGLVYVLVWENLIAEFVDGAKYLSVFAWATSVGDTLASGPGLGAYVGVPVALALLIAVTIGGAIITDQRLRGLSVTSAE